MVELPAVVMVWWFAELALFRCHRVLRAAPEVGPPSAWEMGVISRQKCGHKDCVSASHRPRARRALQGWPMLTQGRGHAAFCSHEKLRASVSPLVVVLALSQCCSEMPQQGKL